MQVLETLHLCTNADTGHSISAAGLKKVIAGSTLSALDPILAKLQELALVHRADPPAGSPATSSRQRFYLPVGSLKDVIGIYPAARTQLHRTCTAPTGLCPAGSAVGGRATSKRRGHPPRQHSDGRSLALQRWTSSPENLRAILATAPERTVGLLDKFGSWAMGAVPPQAQRRASVTHESHDVGPIDWLLARGLLVPLDAGHVELPHSVGLALRGGGDRG